MCVLPFAKEEYLKDFEHDPGADDYALRERIAPNSKAEFEGLFARASGRFILDGQVPETGPPLMGRAGACC